MNDTSPRDCTDDTLLAEFEYAVKWWHYDPTGAREPKFSVPDMREEIRRRMNLRKSQP